MIKLLYVPVELENELPEDWRNKILLYKYSHTPLKISLYELGEGALINRVSGQRLEFNQIIWLRPFNVEYIGEVQQFPAAITGLN